MNTAGEGYKSHIYTVCTCLDERKAIVLVTTAFLHHHPKERISKVLSVERLEGDEALPTDIVDRWEY
jgi:hypothetical protein